MNALSSDSQFLKHLKQPRKAFRDYQKQLAYEDAWSRHYELIVGCTGESNAYQDGYYGTSERKESSILYPYFLAGKDRYKFEPEA